MGAILILVVGLVVSKLFERFSRLFLEKIGLDRLAGKSKLRDWLGRGRVTPITARSIARVLYWIVLLLFLVVSVQTLGLNAVTHTLDRVLGFVPDLVGAALILVLGLLLGRLIRNVVSSSASAANLPMSDRLGAAASGLVILIVVIAALDQLGLETRLLGALILTLIVIGGLTVGVTFALGAKDVLRHILAGHYIRQTFPVGTSVEIQERHGVVAEIGPVSTVIRDGDRSWTIPNAKLLDEIITR
jgi:hypothetical protein